MGMPLLQPTPYAPFRSLLENKDFAEGKMGEGCTFTNFAPNQPKPPRVVNVTVEVRYSPAPNPRAVDEARKQVDERTREHPTDVADLGDAAFWIGPSNNISLFVFRGGTMRLMIGPSEIGLEQQKALAIKALGGTAKTTGKTTSTYGPPPAQFAKPVLGDLGPQPNPADQLKHDLTPKAEKADVKAQLALAKLYYFGTLASDGSAKPDYAGAAYWYQQASDRGEVQAPYQLALLYRDGLGMAENPGAALDLFRKAADAGYVPAMAPLSYAYAAAKTAVSPERATYWAMKAAEANDPEGWLILGFEYNKGWLGGERSVQYRLAMDAYKKAAGGGNCLAMMNIGGLYFNGDGVPQNKTLASPQRASGHPHCIPVTGPGAPFCGLLLRSDWFAKAESCQGKEFDWLREQAAKFRERAVAGRLPAVAKSVSVDAEKIRAGIGALLAFGFAYDLAHPSPLWAPGGAGSGYDLDRKFERDQQERSAWAKLLAPLPKLR